MKKSKINKNLTFADKFNKLKEHSEYKIRMRNWNAIKQLHKVGSIHLYFCSKDYCFKSKEVDYGIYPKYFTAYTKKGEDKVKLNTFIDFYNLLFTK